ALSQELKHELRSEYEKEVHIPLLDQSAVLASFAKMCVPAEDRRVRDDAKQDECVPEPVAREPAKQRNAFAVFGSRFRFPLRTRICRSVGHHPLPAGSPRGEARKLARVDGRWKRRNLRDARDFDRSEARRAG